MEERAIGSYYHKVIEDIKNNRKRRLEGKSNCIPWENFPRLSSKIPGIEQEQYVIVTASSKVGKTQLADYLYVLEPYNYVKKHKEAGIKLKIFYFSLEVSKKKKLMSLLANKIYNETGDIISIQNLNSKFSDYILDAKTEELIEHYIPYFEEFEQTVSIIDNVRNPFGIYKYMRNYAETHGHYKKKIVTLINEKGVREQIEVNDYYIPDDPDEYVIVITDHVSLLLPENGMTLHQAMSKYSSDYCLHMRDKWKYTIVNVQQQAAEQEKQQFNNFGGNVVSKLRPTPDGLGDNKLTGRDCNLMIGLFAPSRYDIKTYNDYDVSLLKDNYRELIVSLNRDGEGFFTDDLLFNGAVNYFEEAPRKILQNEYENIIKRIRR